MRLFPNLSHYFGHFPMSFKSIDKLCAECLTILKYSFDHIYDERGHVMNFKSNDFSFGRDDFHSPADENCILKDCKTPSDMCSILNNPFSNTFIIGGTLPFVASEFLYDVLFKKRLEILRNTINTALGKWMWNPSIAKVEIETIKFLVIYEYPTSIANFEDEPFLQLVCRLQSLSRIDLTLFKMIAPEILKMFAKPPSNWFLGRIGFEELLEYV